MGIFCKTSELQSRKLKEKMRKKKEEEKQELCITFNNMHEFTK